MNAPMHPQDEQLAAMAGGDPEVVADVALRAHVDACDRCGPMVRELGTLRVALAQLPDLAPSRPIQLVPPAAEPRKRGALGGLRTFAAPAMVAGAGMILAGAVGLYGSGFGAAGGAPADFYEDAGRNLSAAEASAAETAAAAPGDNAAASPESLGAPFDGRESTEPLALVETPDWWFVLLVSGAGLLVLGLLFRFAIRPRAG